MTRVAKIPTWKATSGNGVRTDAAAWATADVGRPSVLAVIDAVGSSGLTAYDAAYLVLALSAEARLLTADAALAAAAGERAILVDGGRAVAEEPMRYAIESSWAQWKGAAAYLAELRRAV